MKTVSFICLIIFASFRVNSQNCDSVLVQTKYKYSSKTEMASRISQLMQKLETNTKSNSFGFAANVVIPTSSGPVPIGLKYDNSRTESDYEQILNDFENVSSQTIQLNEEISFVPANQIEAWSKCIQSISNSTFALIYPGNASNSKQLVLNLYLTSKYHDVVIDERKIQSLVYTNHNGEIINDSISWTKIRGGEVLTKIFTISPDEDFYLSVTIDGYANPIEYILKRVEPINTPTYIKKFNQQPFTLGMIDWYHTRTVVLQGFEPNKDVLVDLDYCLEKQCPLTWGGGALENANLKFAVEVNGVSVSCNKDYHYTTGGSMPNCDCNFNSIDVKTSSNGNIVVKFKNLDSTCHNTERENIKVHIKKLEVTAL